MTVDGLLKNGFGAVATPETDREITGVYIGDLLSWVMGRAQSGDAWITIMSNANIVAVAALADTACIIAVWKYPRMFVKRRKKRELIYFPFPALHMMRR